MSEKILRTAQLEEVLTEGEKSQSTSEGKKSDMSCDMCTQERLKSACTSDKSDLSLHCLRQETMLPWLSKCARKDSDQTVWHNLNSVDWAINPCPADPGYTLPLQTV